MVFHRLAIAGLAWTARSVVSIFRTREAPRPPGRAPTVERDRSPEPQEIEPQEIVAPDGRQLEQLGFVEGFEGFEGGGR